MSLSKIASKIGEAQLFLEECRANNDISRHMYEQIHGVLSEAVNLLEQEETQLREQRKMCNV